MLVFFFNFTHEAMGAAGTRHSLRPLYRGTRLLHTTRTHIAPRERGIMRHCERSEAIHLSLRGAMDCFASLAMTIEQLFET
jgi:hypothetical protein